jgi:uncharacterized membrane-anchored protein
MTIYRLIMMLILNLFERTEFLLHSYLILIMKINIFPSFIRTNLSVQFHPVVLLLTGEASIILLHLLNWI